MMFTFWQLPPPAVSELIDDIKKYMQKQLRDPRPNCDTVSVSFMGYNKYL